MNVSEQIAQWLEEKGIKHAFGIIGGGNHILWDAICRRGFTEIVCCHHEQAAVMAAAYYQRTSGEVSVALVTTGAGSTNAITGVMAAYMDSVPVLIFSGNENSKYFHGEMRTYGVQGYRSSKVAEDFTKDSVQVKDSGDVSGYLDYAYRTALKPRQGPVWLDFPKDIQSAPL